MRPFVSARLAMSINTPAKPRLCKFAVIAYRSPSRSTLVLLVMTCRPAGTYTSIRDKSRSDCERALAVIDRDSSNPRIDAANSRCPSASIALVKRHVALDGTSSRACNLIRRRSPQAQPAAQLRRCRFPSVTESPVHRSSVFPEETFKRRGGVVHRSNLHNGAHFSLRSTHSGRNLV